MTLSLAMRIFASPDDPMQTKVMAQTLLAALAVYSVTVINLECNI
jgi:hypothetical protein